MVFLWYKYCIPTFLQDGSNITTYVSREENILNQKHYLLVLRFHSEIWKIWMSDIWNKKSEYQLLLLKLNANRIGLLMKFISHHHLGIQATLNFHDTQKMFSWTSQNISLNLRSFRNTNYTICVNIHFTLCFSRISCCALRCVWLP